MDFANKNCENCTQDIYEKVSSDFSSGFVVKWMHDQTRGTTYITGFTPLEVTIQAERGFYPDEPRQNIYNIAERHCQKSDRHATLKGEWHGGVESIYTFECKSN